MRLGSSGARGKVVVIVDAMVLMMDCAVNGTSLSMGLDMARD